MLLNVPNRACVCGRGRRAPAECAAAPVGLPAAAGIAAAAPAAVGARCAAAAAAPPPTAGASYCAVRSVGDARGCACENSPERSSNGAYAGCPAAACSAASASSAGSEMASSLGGSGVSSAGPATRWKRPGALHRKHNPSQHCESGEHTTSPLKCRCRALTSRPRS